MFQFFNNLKLSQKLILAFITIVLVPVIFITLFSVRNVSRRIEENMEKRVRRTLMVAENVFNDRLNRALENAKSTAQLEDLKRNVQEKNKLKLMNFINTRSVQLNATTLEIADANGNILSRGYNLTIGKDKKPIYDTRLLLTEDGAPEIIKALKFRELTSIDASDEAIILKGIAPMRTLADPFGVVVIGYVIDDHLAQSISEIAGEDTKISIFLKDNLLASSFPDSLKEEVKKDGQIFYEQKEQADVPILKVLKINSKEYLVGHLLVSDDTGTYIGMISASVPYGEVREVKRLSMQLLTIAAFIALLLAILFGFRLARLITKPVLKLVEGANAVANGNFNYQIDVKSKDEIGILGNAFNRMTLDIEELIHSLERLNQVGVALSREHDLTKLLSIIVQEARLLTKADAGNLYILRDKNLSFEISQYDTLDAFYNNDRTKYFHPRKIEISQNTIHGYVAKTGKMLNIDDVYNQQNAYQFTFNKDFDAKHNYRTKSILAVPMMDKDEVIGVLELMNVRERGEIIPFRKESQQLAESLASQAATAIKSSALDQALAIGAFGEENENLANSLASQAAVAIKNADLLKEITTLLFSVVKMSTYLIFARSKHTAGHTRRVHDYAMAMARAMNASMDEKWKDIEFSNDDLEELSIAGWLHDVGKVSIPESVLDKANKLPDASIDAIDMRFQYIEQWFKATASQENCTSENSYSKEAQNLLNDLTEKVGQLREELKFIKDANIPGVSGFLKDESIERLQSIAQRTYLDIYSKEHNYLTEEELKNLSIRLGSLTKEERKQINDHIIHTISILQTIPWPKKWKNVTYIAGAHHEKLNGKGYPNGLIAEELNTQCRILAIADIFDALTSKRPYKDGMPPEKAFKILEEEFVARKHIDGDILELLKQSKCYEPILASAKDEKEKDDYSIFQF